mmetsp:Transcript_2842/g.13281  ORF Transcript_2842/g.13281 Transcript_2842/m.13281 type:complete len:237 (-) Transcript_2842:188-898(-)
MPSLKGLRYNVLVICQVHSALGASKYTLPREVSFKRHPHSSQASSTDRLSRPVLNSSLHKLKGCAVKYSDPPRPLSSPREDFTSSLFSKALPTRRTQEDPFSTISIGDIQRTSQRQKLKNYPEKKKKLGHNTETKKPNSSKIATQGPAPTSRKLSRPLLPICQIVSCTSKTATRQPNGQNKTFRVAKKNKNWKPPSLQKKILPKKISTSRPRKWNFHSLTPTLAYLLVFPTSSQPS